MDNSKIKASETSLDQVLDKVTETNQPLIIEANDKSFVVLSEDDWRGLQETLYFYSQPGFLERFKQASQSEELFDLEDLDLI